MQIIGKYSESTVKWGFRRCLEGAKSVLKVVLLGYLEGA